MGALGGATRPGDRELTPGIDSPQRRLSREEQLAKVAMDRESNRGFASWSKNAGEQWKWPTPGRNNFLGGDMLVSRLSSFALPMFVGRATFSACCLLASATCCSLRFLLISCLFSSPQPFPENPYFKPTPPLSTALQAEIYAKYTQYPSYVTSIARVNHLAEKYAISKDRIRGMIKTGQVAESWKRLVSPGSRRAVSRLFRRRLVRRPRVGFSTSFPASISRDSFSLAWSKEETGMKASNERR